MKRAARILACVVVTLVALAAAPAVALESRAALGPVEVVVRLEPDAPVIGDAMTLSVEAMAEPDVEVLMPEFGEALQRFAITDFTPREKLGPDGRTHFSQRYTLQSPRSGSHVLPAIVIEFVDRRPGRAPAPEDLDAYELLTEPIPFEVESVVPDAAEAELSPPMGPLSPRLTGARNPWLWLAGFALIALGTVPFLFGAWVRWKARAAVRSAYELARGELDALLAGPKPRGEQIDAFFVELSGIARRYLERRFQLRSPELTTERFLEQVSGSPDLSQNHQDLLRDFLRQADLVKFAHVIPEPRDIEEAIGSVLQFIEETRDDAPDRADAPHADAQTVGA